MPPHLPAPLVYGNHLLQGEGTVVRCPVFQKHYVDACGSVNPKILLVTVRAIL
jgi:hypothetical protein